MLTVRERRLEQERVRQASRERNKRAKSPVLVEVDIDDVKYVTPVSKEYVPLFTIAKDDKLVKMANKYNLPVSEEQKFLLETGDVFLEQYPKQRIADEEITSLYVAGWNPLVSSNLKAVKVVEDDLQILFHNDAIYEYPKQANMYYPFSEALSPGRLLWRTIRRIKGYRQIA
jgi:hypothetical protein